MIHLATIPRRVNHDPGGNARFLEPSNWLEDDREVRRKQRHTAKRVFERLRAEHGFTGGYTIVKDYMRERRGREMFVPLAHPPGHAQADFGEGEPCRAIGPSVVANGKRIGGRKRHILADTDGRLLAVEVHGAEVQDRDSAKGVVKRSRRRFPFVERVFADGG